MGRSGLAVCLAVAMMFVLVTSVPAWAKPSAAESDRLFDPELLWTIHLRLSKDDWKKMEPLRTPRVVRMLELVRKPATAPATQKTAEEDAPTEEEELDRRRPNSFGFRYAYVRGTLEFEGKVYRDVGIRFKGNSSYSSAAQGMKRPFKIDFNRFVEDQRFLGLTQINLNNNAFDMTQIREALSYEVFREAGVPAPRTSLAMVYLSIEGQNDRTYLGVYTIVEEVNKPFLKNHFDNTKGLLLKPEGSRGLPYLGENWSAYTNYQPKTDASDITSRRFIEFTKLIHQADDETFKRQIGEYLEMDGFLRFVAVTTLLVNLDSILNTGHNFYMYVHPKDQKVHFVPWDLNLSLGGFGPMTNMEERTGLSIMHPYPGENRLIDRILAIEEHKKAYREHLKRIAETSFAPERLQARIEAMAATVRKAEQIALAEKKMAQPTAPVGNLGRQMPELKEFVTKRAQSVQDQLAGKTEGFVPETRRGALAMALGGRPGVLGLAFLKGTDANGDKKMAREEMEATIQRFFEANDKDQNGVMDEKSLTDALVGVLPRIEGNPNGAQGKGAPNGRQADQKAEARRPAALMARLIIREADTNGDKRVSSRELLRTARAMFVAADKSRDNVLDEKEITEAMNRIGQQPGPQPPPPPPQERPAGKGW